MLQLAMNIDEATDIVRQTLIVALTISAPILGVGLTIGLCVSLFQAVTQIQEQTLSFVPKIVGMIVVLLAIIPWIGTTMLEFTQQMFNFSPIP